MDEISTVPDRRLGDFSSVDTEDKSNLVVRLDAMHQLSTFRSYKQETFSLLDIASRSVVADVGCGTGEDVHSLSRLVSPGGQVVGVDLSEAMLDQARERHGGLAGVSFRQLSTQSLPAEDESFDAIRADRVLIHVPRPCRDHPGDAADPEARRSSGDQRAGHAWVLAGVRQSARDLRGHAAHRRVLHIPLSRAKPLHAVPRREPPRRAARRASGNRV